MAILDGYWRQYDATLARVRSEKPTTFAALKAILDAFEPPSSGDAFFPGGGDDDLFSALLDAGWQLKWFTADYFFAASCGDAVLTYVEGDVYEGDRR